MSNEKAVARAVYLQRTSPNFAEFCISHVTDPTHLFLYSHKDTPDRRLYLRLLDEARTATAAQAAPKRGAADSSSPPSSLFFAAQTYRESDLCDTSRAPCFSDYDITTLCENMAELFASPATRTPTWLCGAKRQRTDERNGHDDSSPAAPATVAVVVGPHAPHLFRSSGALRHFVRDLVLRAAENPEKANTDAVLRYMTESLPQTEAYLYVLLYVCEELLHFAARQRVQEAQHATRSAADGTESLRREGEPSEEGHEARESPQPAPPVTWVRYTEGATAVIYMASQLLSAHRGHAAALAAVVAASPTRRGAASAGVYYQAVFDRYLRRMLEAFLGAVARPADEGGWEGGRRSAVDSAGTPLPGDRAVAEAAQFVLDVVRMWRADGALQLPNADAVMVGWEGKLETVAVGTNHDSSIESQ